jgi:DNA-directed RNA polymerase specialized sigma24 family protein
MQASDMDLVRDFAASNSDAAFAALVERHVNLVYSAALRRLGNSHEAEEVAQVVFIILARSPISILTCMAKSRPEKSRRRASPLSEK